MLFGLFLLQFALVWTRLWLPWPLLGNARWPDGLLVLLTTATVLASLTRQLPGQNVMLASIIIAFIAGAVQTLGALTAIPFGPCVYTDDIGQQLFYPLPWAVPLVWIAVLLASRGVARLMLRPWRNTQAYGFRLIGFTTLLVVLLDVGLEPFATRVKHYWFWNPTKLKFDWYTHAVGQLLWLGGYGAAHSRVRHALAHQQETDATAAAGLFPAGRLAPAEPPLRDRRRRASALAGGRADRLKQRWGGSLRHPRRAVVKGGQRAS